MNLMKKDVYGNVTCRLFTDWRAFGVWVDVPRSPSALDPLGQWMGFGFHFLGLHFFKRWRTCL